MRYFGRLAVVGFLFTLVTAGLAAQVDIINVPLQWQAVKGAGGYRLELQDGSGQITLSEDLTETKTTLHLEPGSYQLRVSTLNRFGKPEAGTPWTPLVIKPIPVPVIARVQPANIPEDEPVTLKVTSAGVDAKTTWELIPAQGTPLPLTAKPAGETWTIDLPAVAQGSYTLRATGKTGKVGELARAVTVRPHDPVVSTWSLLPATEDQPLRLQFAGRYLYPGTTVTFAVGEQQSDVTVGDVANLTSATIPVPDQPGAYRVSLTGAGDSVAVIPALTVLPVPEVPGIISLPSATRTVTLPVKSGSPALRVFIEYGSARREISQVTQSPARLSFDVPDDLRSAGTYKLWVVNSQGRQAEVTDGLILRNDGSVQGSSASVAITTVQDGAKGRIDGGAWTDLPHTFDQLEAGQNYQISFSVVDSYHRYLATPAVSVTLDPHEELSIPTNYSQGHSTLNFGSLADDEHILVDGTEVESSSIKAGRVSVESGDISVEIVSATGQIWARTLTLLPDETAEAPLSSFAPVVPQRKIMLDGTLDDWDGLVPISKAKEIVANGDPGTQITAIWSARDEKFLYFRFDLDALPPKNVTGFNYNLSFVHHGRWDLQVAVANGLGTTTLVNATTRKATKLGSFQWLPSGFGIKIPFDALSQADFEDGETILMNQSVAFLRTSAKEIVVAQPQLAVNKSFQIRTWDAPAAPTVPTVSTLASGLAHPAGVAVDLQGNVFVADSGSHSILKVTADGTVSTFAGNGKVGKSDGTGAGAGFNRPDALAFGPGGDLFVADTDNHLIRKISPKGQVTTLAGSGWGQTDGKGAKAGFNLPTAIAVDRFGTVFVVDVDGPTGFHIRRITPDGVVTTVAQASLAPPTDPNPTLSLSARPLGLVVAATGDLFVTDPTNHAISRIDGVTESLVDWKPNLDSTTAQPTGLAADVWGNLYFTDAGTHQVVKVSPTGSTTVVAGTGVAGTKNGPGSVASFNGPEGIAVGQDGTLYVADSLNHRVRAIVGPAEEHPTVAWTASTSAPAGALNFPTALAFGAGDITYGIDGNKIFQRATDAKITIVAGSDEAGNKDGSGSDARFNHPEALTVVGDGVLYIADTQNNKIRVISHDGIVATLGGTLSHPQGIAISKNGTIYVSDSDNHRIMRDAAAKGKAQTTWELFVGPKQVTNPGALAFDHRGNLYVIDGNRIKVINPTGIAATVAGRDRAGIGQDSTTDALFSSPKGLAIDSQNNLYVADTGTDRIRQISPEGVVTTLAGKSRPGNWNGTGPEASFDHPWGIALGADGSIVVSDAMNQSLRQLSLRSSSELASEPLPDPSATVLPTWRTIKMDGRLEGWAGIRPNNVRLGYSRWEKIPGTAINAIYYAEDENYLYWMMTTVDGRFRSDAPINFAVEINLGERNMSVKINGWSPRVPQLWYEHATSAAWDSTSPSDFCLGEGFVAARFPMAVLRRYSNNNTTYHFWVHTAMGGEGVKYSEGTDLGGGLIRF